MPTYNREFIIELAIRSILSQLEHTWKIELVIADDGEDKTPEIIERLKEESNGVNIVYIKHERMPLSDKFNFMVEKSSGDYYGLVGSDDIQSPYKVSAFEKAIALHPDGDIFGQWQFAYHDIVFNNSRLWTQNKDLHLFKAGSFTMVKKSLFTEYGGYDPGLWRSVDSSFAAKLKDVKLELVDMGKLEPRILQTAIALQHLDNIWRRKSKGFRKKNKQTRNFLSEEVQLKLDEMPGDVYSSYLKIQTQIQSQLTPLQKLYLYLKK